MDTVSHQRTYIAHRFRPVSTLGIAGLVVFKSTDLVTTILGLTAVDGLIERNPLAALLFRTTGIPGLVAVSIVTVLMVVLVTEWAVNVLSTSSKTAVSPAVVYLISYVPLCLLFAITTVNNVVLLLRVTIW